MYAGDPHGVIGVGGGGKKNATKVDDPQGVCIVEQPIKILS
jgi:hypothetical protein